ncbi:MAG: sodium:proton antiporter [Alphaproteobacteria bacterium]|nr:sodium:proton antiporter [Alphaproteobacteria bacterium]
MRLARILALSTVLMAAAPAAWAASGPNLDGSNLSLLWFAPFAGLLLSIALLPILTPAFWHHHYGKVTAFWAVACVIPLMMEFGTADAAHELFHVAIADYIPFMLLLTALYVVAGGIAVSGQLVGTPAVNTAILAFGTLLAGWIGTTGASMLLIRFVIATNRNRTNKTHIFVFFIFLVSNIGGSMTPLGDPPLFLGYLNGIDFFWPLIWLTPPLLLCVVVLLVLFYALDTFFFRADRESHPAPQAAFRSIRVRGGLINMPLLLGIVFAVLLSGSVKTGVAIDVFGVEIKLENLLRDLALLGLILLSLRLTPTFIRRENSFTWGPMVEVIKLFAGIFATIIPCLAILKAGKAGAAAAVHELLTRPDGTPINAMYFWVTGTLSSFLDNAPTYLIFFNVAGGDAVQLMGPLAATLLAISAGAVFMGSNTYIGNAPNLMVKAVVEANDIRMPSFFGYMLWSCGILLPLFVVVAWVFF